MTSSFHYDSSMKNYAYGNACKSNAHAHTHTIKYPKRYQKKG